MLRVERAVPYLVAPIEFGDIADRFAAMMMIDDEIRDIVDRHACLESTIHEFGVFGCAEGSPRSEVLVEKADPLENRPWHGKITTMQEAAWVTASIVDLHPALGLDGEWQIAGIAKFDPASLDRGTCLIAPEQDLEIIRSPLAVIVREDENLSLRRLNPPVLGAT